MTERERLQAVLKYQDYDRLPIVHFGFWPETLQKWQQEGHLTEEEVKGWSDGSPMDAVISEKLGFDYNYYSTFSPNNALSPHFESKVIKEFPDGTKHVLNGEGVVVLQEPEAGSIPGEIEHTLTDRQSWEEHYKWRYAWSEDRILKANVRVNDKMVPFNEGGLEFLKKDERTYPYGIHAGSLFGHIRNVLGVVGSSYMLVDDEELFDEIIDTVGTLCYDNIKYTLETGAKFDFAHFWEDICYKNGPLISPDVFHQKVGPYYKRISELLAEYDISIVSLDCDGLIDSLIPTWLENGVNTMFPIEVGTWDANIKPWREQYGKQIRGVGGMNKTVFAKDKTAIDQEVERLSELVKLGGYIPCPDHRIAPDAKWELVQYYTEKLREATSF